MFKLDKKSSSSNSIFQTGQLQKSSAGKFNCAKLCQVAPLLQEEPTYANFWSKEQNKYCTWSRQKSNYGYMKFKPYFFNIITENDIPTVCQCCFWLGEFSNKVTDGDAVYQEMKRFSEQFANTTKIESTTFQRLAPRSEVSKDFKLDSLKIEPMKKAVKDEAEDDPRYFQDILAAAIVIAARKIEGEEKLDVFASICVKMVKWALYTGQKAGKDLKTKKKIPEMGFNIAKALHKAAADIAKNNVSHLKSLNYFGETLFELEQFSKAREKFEECKSIFYSDYSDTRDDEYIIRLKARVLRYLGKCHYELGDYDESEETFIEAIETTQNLPKSQDTDILRAQIKINMSLTLLELNEFKRLWKWLMKHFQDCLLSG